MNLRRVSALLVLTGLALTGCGGQAEAEASRSAEASERAAAWLDSSRPREVVLEVEPVGKTGTVALPKASALGRITVNDGSGTEQGQYRLPLMNKGGTEGVTYKLGPGEVLSMNAQLVEHAEGILCRITVDGEVVSEKSSGGRHAVVSCVARIE